MGLTLENYRETLSKLKSIKTSLNRKMEKAQEEFYKRNDAVKEARELLYKARKKVEETEVELDEINRTIKGLKSVISFQEKGCRYE